MTLQEIYTRLSTITSLNDVGYRVVKPKTALPYAVYYANETFYGADLHNTLNQKRVTIELYSKTKNTTLEQSIENAFNDVELNKNETWIDDDTMQGVLEVIYEFNAVSKI